MTTKIVHLSSVHPRYDTRIFIKECSSLAKIPDYEVSLVIADGQGNEIKNNVTIYDVGAKHGSRLSRMTKTVNKVYQKAVELDADVYHLHDPELIPIGVRLKSIGKKIIFDAHEDLPNQIKNKHYLNKISRVLLSDFAKKFEQIFCAKFDGIIVAAEPVIKDKFLKINPNTEVINNFPKIEELGDLSNFERIPNQVCYIGGLAETRGIIQITQAAEQVKDASFVIAGNFPSQELEKRVTSMAGWQKVNFVGYVDREGIQKVLGTSAIGLVTLHPTPSYINSMPVKMFEYMCAGIPVIASNFELWKQIVEGAGCGICVDPFDTSAIAIAIDYLVENPQKAKDMGRNGRKAVEEQYCWEAEERRLIKFYDNIL